MAEEKDDEMKKEEFEKEIFQKNKNEFHKKYISKKHILKNNIITAVSNSGSSFCKKSISSGLYQYKFKIGRINSLMIIGIWKIQKNKTPPTDTLFTKGKYQGYGFDVCDGKLTNRENGGINGKHYGIECLHKPGTIITMNINMKKYSKQYGKVKYLYELSYTINDTDYGIAFKIKKAEYKVAVYIYNKGDSIELLQ